MKIKLHTFFMSAMLLAASTIIHVTAHAQKAATVMVNSKVTYQKITGFGGFVNSPQFAYGHMTENEIKTLWGANSETGYNIMRLYIPIGESNWPQALSTAQLAQSLGLKIFASPWSMPAEWKTYNTINAVYTDENNVKHDVYLKEENYADYANYLNNFVTYMKNNGVDLYAISPQNEPDERAEYAGCIWTPAQMAKFLKDNASVINCRVIAPESVGFTDNYVNALNSTDVLQNFEIYGGHQYGSLQSGFKNIQAKGKEAWMTEYLINWNNNITRDFSWSIDAFSFAGKLNEAMLANINAWVHYASKRYYGMMGDGTNGTTAGVVTKRGYILSHFAKYATGATRIENTWNDNTNALSGSSYLSVTGDSVIVMVINPSNNAYSLAIDLPFLTQSGKSITTTQTVNMAEAAITPAEQTHRPKVNISASSFTTVIFTKSGDYVPSQMTGEPVSYDSIENQVVTNPAFGTGHMLSGKTVTFKVDIPLISNNTTNSNGYLKLTDKFNRLVFRVESISSAGSYTSANTTLYYVNDAGAVNSYNYGTVNFDKRSNFDMSFDISKNVLTDGCQGVIGIRNSNYSSILTIKFANVYFAVGTEKGYRFSGVYSNDDSRLLDALDDTAFTTLDFTAATSIPSQTNWNAAAVNKNCVFYVQAGADVSNKTNVIAGTNCSQLDLVYGGGNFYSPLAFNATAATFHSTLNGYKMLVLPFEANIPEGVKAYNLEFTNPDITGRIITTGKIPANIPVLVVGSGTFTFMGSGNVTSPLTISAGITNGTYIGIKVPTGNYYLTNINGVDSFARVMAGAQPSIGAFDGYISLDAAVTAGRVALKLDDSALPIVLGTFTAKPDGKQVRLNWNTFSEGNNAGFDVERSNDGITFKKINFVKGNANSHLEKRYTTVDNAPLAGKSYYRLKQIDADGAFSFSNIEAVFMNGIKPSITLYPNPLKSILNINVSGFAKTETIVVFNARGQVVLKHNVKPSGVTTVDVSALLPGIYFYNVNNEKGSFVKQ